MRQIFRTSGAFHPRCGRRHSKDGKTETFDFLGFTHINRTTLTGKYTVLHRISQKKLQAKKHAVKEWLGTYIQGKPSDTIELLNKKLVGHYGFCEERETNLSLNADFHCESEVKVELAYSTFFINERSDEGGKSRYIAEF